MEKKLVLLLALLTTGILLIVLYTEPIKMNLDAGKDSNFFVIIIVHTAFLASFLSANFFYEKKKWRQENPGLKYDVLLEKICYHIKHALIGCVVILHRGTQALSLYLCNNVMISREENLG